MTWNFVEWVVDLAVVIPTDTATVLPREWNLRDQSIPRNIRVAQKIPSHSRGHRSSPFKIVSRTLSMTVYPCFHIYLDVNLKVHESKGARTTVSLCLLSPSHQTWSPMLYLPTGPVTSWEVMRRHSGDLDMQSVCQPSRPHLL